MPQYCQLIIDTPEFQRLRFIKQLGCTCYVFPSAVHTRFEHSIGVSYLAGNLASMLKQEDANANMTDTDVICVRIAGLCHDLGHGPFSNAFGDIVPPGEDGKKWSHKEQSVIMFEHLIEQNDLKKKLKEYDILQLEIDFICELILGRPRGKGDKLLRENMFYLHQIVNNSANQVDVDKWDYFARDALYLGINSAFDFNRITPFIKVFDVERTKGETRKELCFRDKVANDLNHMFLTRRRLHYSAYEHRVTKIISLMLKDALRAAADHLIFVGKDEVKCNLLESVKDPMAFRQVNDTIVNEIMRSSSREQGIVKAQAILGRIHDKRHLYQCIGTYQYNSDVAIHRLQLDPAKIKQEISNNSDELWYAENIEVEVSYFDYGDGGKNPLLNIPFYMKSHGSTGRGMFLPKEKLSVDLPERLQDVSVTVYTKVPNVDLETLKNARNRGHKLLEKIISPSKVYKSPPIEGVPFSLPTGKITPLKMSGSDNISKEILRIKPTVKSPIGIPPATLEAGLDEPMDSKSNVVRSELQEAKDDPDLKRPLYIDLTAQSSDIGTYCDITVKKVRETPGDLPLKDDEVVISYGLHLTSSGSKPSSPVKIRMPHCGIFSKPEKAEIVLYTRDNGSGKFTTLSPSDNGAPRCVVREKDLDLYMNHFSSWWIIAFIRSYFIGKRFICTPYVPTHIYRRKVNVIYMFLKEDIGLKEEQPDGLKKAFVEEQFPVEWRKGELKITCLENDDEVGSKTLPERQLQQCNYEHISFMMKARDTRESRSIITFNLEQSISKEIQFPIDFEESTPTQSPHDSSISSQAESQQSMKDNGVPEKTLFGLAEAIGNHKNLMKLAFELGFDHDKSQEYSASNVRPDGQFCSNGTRNMLMDWKRRTAKLSQVPMLKRALEAADFVELAEEHFG